MGGGTATPFIPLNLPTGSATGLHVTETAMYVNTAMCNDGVGGGSGLQCISEPETI